MVKSLPAMWETWVRSLGWEGPLEKGKATYSSILTWRIPQTTVHGCCKELDTTERLSLTQSQASVGMVLDTAWVFIFQGHGLVYIFKRYRDNASFLLGILECNCLLSEV